MALFFIETIEDADHHPDPIGTTFPNVEGAMKAALWALLDIVHDAADVRTQLDATVVVKDVKGAVIFQATLVAGGRLQPEFRTETVLQAGTLTPKYSLSA